MAKKKTLFKNICWRNNERGKKKLLANEKSLRGSQTVGNIKNGYWKV